MKAPAKPVCFEAYWNEKMLHTSSVKGFFEAMAPLQHPPLSLELFDAPVLGDMLETRT